MRRTRVSVKPYVDKIDCTCDASHPDIPLNSVKPLSDADQGLLIIDCTDQNSKHIKPPAFRTAASLSNPYYASASGQFHGDHVDFLKAHALSFDRNKILVIDLRHEPHGFAGGLPISCFKCKNMAGFEMDEDTFLHRLGENYGKTLELHEIVVKAGGSIWQSEVKYVDLDATDKLQSEKDFLRSHGLDYCRIHVVDHHRPSDLYVDMLIEVILTHQSHWMHFHCRGGKGRSSVAICMMDMIVNRDKGISFNDFLKRRHVDLEAAQSPSCIHKAWKSPTAKERYAFLKSFWVYTNECPKGFKNGTQWSVWAASSRD